MDRTRAGGSRKVSVNLPGLNIEITETGTPWPEQGAQSGWTPGAPSGTYAGCADPPEAGARSPSPAPRQKGQASRAAARGRAAQADRRAEERFPVPPEQESFRHRHYVIFRAVGYPQLEGLWFAPWSWVELHLPAPTLGECKNVSLRGFDSEEQALAFWQLKCGTRAAPRRT